MASWIGQPSIDGVSNGSVRNDRAIGYPVNSPRNHGPNWRENPLQHRKKRCPVELTGNSGRDQARRTRVEVLGELTSPISIARHARIAIRLGCSPVQAYQLAIANYLAPILFGDFEPAAGELDLPNVPEPHWQSIVGKN